MDVSKILEINKAIRDIELNPELSDFEKYYELLILKNELEELKTKKNTQSKPGYNMFFGLN
ncbi:hypothetical protein [Tenacibaculum sp. 47A_GOM-205m]|uniref:hypothetical protein n=1 Tax=Tenacibaculum sp. 47A_GOM-205m TaxID=1380384 RepID=UPI00048F9CA5|nr:hypothetical protein [Tenacibaculum sp. 47A_GOM-205m]